MTERLPEFASLPIEGVFDEELFACGDDGLPSFDRLSRRMLHGDTSIPVALILSCSSSKGNRRVTERRELLELLDSEQLARTRISFPWPIRLSASRRRGALLGGRMDDQDIARRVAGDALTDASSD